MSSKYQASRFSPKLGASILLLFYTIGVVGILSPWAEYFIPLSPLNLLLSFVVLVYFHQGYNLPFVAFMLLCYVTGFAAEWVGVHTGYLFGEYAYGKVLGPAFDSIPLIIGLNWYLLTYITVDIAKRTKQKPWVQIVFGALLMTCLDFIIEPVAIRLDFWQWFGKEPPLSNYLGWFVVSLPLQYAGNKWHSGNNPVAIWLFLSMLLFFVSLNLL